MAEADDIIGGYLPSFVQHLQDTRARLGLRVGSQANAGQATAGEVAEEEGTDATGWTPAEHDALFRAISVHSRWRPDLIAACVPTKSEWDVWMYLEALEEGAATLAVQPEDESEEEDMDMDEDEDEEDEDDEDGDWDSSVDEMEMDVDSGPCSPSGSDADEDMESCEPALEVSQAWIDAEERMASWIIYQEHLALVEGDTEDVDDKSRKRKRRRSRRKKEREGSEAQGEGVSALVEGDVDTDTDTEDMDHKPRKQKRGRSRGKRERAQGSETNKASPSPIHDPSCEGISTSQSKRSRDHSTLCARKREALMARLELPHLQVLDNILREGQAMKEQSKSREGSVTMATPLEDEDDEPSHPCDVKASSLSDRITDSQGTINIPGSSSGMVIDPVLSGDVDPTGRRSRQAPSGGNETSGAPSHVPAQGSSLSPNVSPHPLGVPTGPAPGNTFTFPQDNAVPTGSNSNANAESDLSLLSPRSRRQIRKRLYMRRKRALLRGDSAAPETGVEKLKPGKKKATMEQRETSVVSTSMPCSEAPSDAEGELPENVRKKHTPGITLPYKLKAQFAESGVDAAYLVSQGMDLLNLGALGKFMRLLSTLEHNEETEEALAGGMAFIESIDAQLIQHLQAAVVSFVTDIIHRAIVWREREKRLKQRNRAWRQGDQITIGAIEHAVEIIGARYYSHKAYLRALEARYGLSTEASSIPANATDEPNPRDSSVDPDVGASDLAGKHPGLSVHRDMYTPRIYPPSAWGTTPLRCLTRTYEREASRTRRGTSAEIGEDELMPDETDEEALEAELEDEEEVDERDMTLGTAAEEALWGRKVKEEIIT